MLLTIVEGGLCAALQPLTLLLPAATALFALCEVSGATKWLLSGAVSQLSTQIQNERREACLNATRTAKAFIANREHIDLR